MAMSVPLGMATAGSCGRRWYYQAACGIPLGLSALAEARESSRPDPGPFCSALKEETKDLQDGHHPGIPGLKPVR